MRLGCMKRLQMKRNYPKEFYICVVSYENTGKETEFIPQNCWGASGLVAVDAIDEEELVEILRAGFNYLELKIVEIGDIIAVSSLSEVEARDSHLAENVMNWEVGHRWVIGTVHGYYGEGTG